MSDCFYSRWIRIPWLSRPLTDVACVLVLSSHRMLFGGGLANAGLRN